MKLTANAQQVATEILEAFKSGAVPKALAQTFLSLAFALAGATLCFLRRRAPSQTKAVR
jgi:hypothetical protein